MTAGTQTLDLVKVIGCLLVLDFSVVWTGKGLRILLSGIWLGQEELGVVIGTEGHVSVLSPFSTRLPWAPSLLSPEPGTWKLC